MYSERSAEIKVRGDEGIGGIGGSAVVGWGGSCVDLRSVCFRRAAATVGEVGAALGVNCEDRAV